MTRPLQGLRVLVPRPASRSAALCGLLADAGAVPLPVPLVEAAPQWDSPAVRAALRNLAAGAFDWVAFTSPTAVDAFQAVSRGRLEPRSPRPAIPPVPHPREDSARARESAGRAREDSARARESAGRAREDSARARESAGRAQEGSAPAGEVFARAQEAAPGGTAALIPASTHVAAVGRATAAALADAGMPVDLVPDESSESGAGLAAAWPTQPPHQAVLLPRSDRARHDLEVTLRSAGHEIRPVTFYRTVVLRPAAPLVADLETGRIDAVIVTSPSTCAALSAVAIAPNVVIVAIGATTAVAARQHGIHVTSTADQPSDAGLVAALGRAVSRAEKQ